MGAEITGRRLCEERRRDLFMAGAITIPGLLIGLSSFVRPCTTRPIGCPVPVLRSD